MGDCANIGFVDSHPKRIGSENDRLFATKKAFLHSLAIDWP